MTTETRSPSQTTTVVAGWSNPTNAYSSDNQRTSTNTVNAEQEYSGYGFNVPSGATISKVEVGVEGYTDAGEILDVKIHNGSAWYTKEATSRSEETMEWLDFTANTNWSPSKVNSVKTRIVFGGSGGGGDTCYPEQTFLLCVDVEGNYVVKRCSDIEPGDRVLGYKKGEGYHYCHVVNVEKHEGEFDVLKITVDKSPTIKNIDINMTVGTKSWKEYIYVTPNHEVHSPTQGGRVKCGLLRVGDSLTDLHLGQMITVPIISIEKTRFKGTVYNVKLDPCYEDFFYFIVSLDKEHVETLENLLGKDWNLFKRVEFSLFGLGIKTWYVDWLPVRVTYTEAAVGHSTKASMTKVGA